MAKEAQQRNTERLAGMAQLEVELGEVREQLARAVQAANSGGAAAAAAASDAARGVQTREELVRELALLQESHAVTVARASSLETEAKIACTNRSLAEQEAAVLKEEIARLQADIRQREEAQTRAAHKHMFVARERDGLRQILQSYDEAVKEGASDFDKQQKERYQLLEVGKERVERAEDERPDSKAPLTPHSPCLSLGSKPMPSCRSGIRPWKTRWRRCGSLCNSKAPPRPPPRPCKKVGGGRGRLQLAEKHGRSFTAQQHAPSAQMRRRLPRRGKRARRMRTRKSGQTTIRERPRLCT